MKPRAKCPIVIVLGILFLAFGNLSAQVSADLIASHISVDSGRPKENYREYSERLAALLNGLTPAALARVLGDYTPSGVEPLSLNEELGLNSINFTPYSSDLSPSAFAELDKVREYLLDNPNARIMIEGHTDANKAIDQPLSEARADAAKLYLAQSGIDPGRIETIGYANTIPLIEGNSKEARDANRRIEVKVLN